LKPLLAVLLCVLLLSTLLLVAACGNYYQNPASPPNGTPQATPTKSGYSIIVLIDNEMQSFFAPYIRQL
jgi:hypothetical protein